MVSYKTNKGGVNWKALRIDIAIKIYFHSLTFLNTREGGNGWNIPFKKPRSHRLFA